MMEGTYIRFDLIPTTRRKTKVWAVKAKAGGHPARRSPLVQCLAQIRFLPIQCRVRGSLPG